VFDIKQTGLDDESAPDLAASEPVSITVADSWEGFEQIQSLMATVKSQAVDFRVQHAKAASDWTLGLNVMTSRIATLEPLLNKAVDLAKDRQREVDRLALSNEQYKKRLADAERQLFHYRPLAIQLDEDLRTAKGQLEEGARHIGTLEAEFAKSQGAFNDLFQKLATAEAVGRRVAEEHQAYSQKLSESDLAIQTLMRESAQLKSELMTVTCDLESAKKETSELVTRLGAEMDEHKRTQAMLETMKSELLALKKDNAAHTREVEEQERRAAESLASKDKQIYDLQVKISGMNSKSDFLNREIQRLRDDLRRHLDHIGNLEGSNRQLLDALSRTSNVSANGNGKEAQTEAASAPSSPPKLRAISE
jgi:chromosome segregation ATPase